VPGSPESRIRHPLDPRNPLAGIYLAVMLFELAEGALRFLVPLNLDRRGLGPEAVGFVFATFALTSLLSRGAAGALFRPWRARRLVVVAGIASTAAYLVTPFVTDVGAFAALMAIDGFGWGIATTCLLAVMMTSTPASMSPAVAMGWFVGFQGIAFALATTVGGVLAQLVGIQTAMLVLATVPVLAAVLISARLPGGRPEPGTGGIHVESGEAEISPRGALAWLRGSAGTARGALVALPMAVWAAAVVAVYLNVMNGLLQSFFPLLGLALGLSFAQIGTLSTMRSGASAIARFGAGWLFARVPARRLHLPLLAMSAMTIMAAPTAGTWLLIAPLFALNGVSRGLLRVTTGAAAMESLQGRQAGLAAALMTAGLDVGKLIGPLVGGLVAGAIGLGGMFQVVPLAFLLVFGGFYLLARRRPPTGTGDSATQPADGTPA
jgi:MFS transporter, DHA1 family, chloramphenicol resistance protein